MTNKNNGDRALGRRLSPTCKRSKIRTIKGRRMLIRRRSDSIYKDGMRDPNRDPNQWLKEKNNENWLGEDTP